MDKHEAALRTYEILQKRKAEKEKRKQADIAACGWNGYTRYMVDSQRKYYGSKHTSR